MRHENISEATSVNLIAISTGSATERDLRKSLEWKVYETGYVDYYFNSYHRKFKYRHKWVSDKGNFAMLFSLAMAFSRKAAFTETLGPEFERAFPEGEQQADANSSPTSSNIDLITDTVSSENTWFRARHRFFEAQDESTLNQDASGEASLTGWPRRHGRDDLVCEFYNVLWVEHIEGIAYRRACGWVPKYIWEAHASGPEQVTLG
jgi:hypothetical protein